MSESLTDAVAAVYDAVLPLQGTGPGQLTKVYDYLPKSGNRVAGKVVTVLIGGMTPDDYVIAVRLYIDSETPESDAARLAQMIEAVDAAMYASPHITATTWEADPPGDRVDAWVASALCLVPRESGFPT